MNTQQEIRAKAIELAIAIVQYNNVDEIMRVAKILEEYMGTDFPKYVQPITAPYMAPVYSPPPFQPNVWPYQISSTTASIPSTKVQTSACNCGGQCGCGGGDCNKGC